MNYKELLATIGAAVIVSSPLIFQAVYTEVNSSAKRINTSRGEVLVRNWDNSQGLEATLGFTTIHSKDDRGVRVPSFKTEGIMGRVGAGSWTAQLTDADRSLFVEAVAKYIEQSR